MNAIGLNPIKLDAIGLDPIRMNAIRLGVPGASSDSGRPYIDPELLSHVKMAISTWGKTNDDPDRAVLKDLTPNGNDMRLLNFGFTEGSGYGLPGTDFEGWLCTDGVDDMIESVKPVSEMLEGSNEITVVSIIHQISQIPRSESNKGLNNQIVYYDTPNTRGYLRNRVSDIGKTGIYGYTFDGTTHAVINNILGDKGDYIAVRNNEGIALNGVFSVCGYKNYYGELKELSSVAYAGGFIANKVLTSDEINQIIAYYNLDRPGQIIKPQLYCNVKKQGITNDNHAEFNDQLIDFVGGHNIQLNNIGWEGESGINSYPVIFGANKTWEAQGSKDGDKYYIYTSSANKFNITQIKISSSLFYSYIKRNGGLTVFNKDIPSFKIKVTGLESTNLLLRYNFLNSANATTKSISNIVSDGVHELPKSFASDGSLTDDNFWIGLSFIKKSSEIPDVIGNVNITIEVLPTIEHALCLDGINDFGKVTGLPVLKDYTVVADRKILGNNGGGTLSKSYSAGNGAFIFETGSVNYSFGTGTSGSGIQSKRMLSYLSKYIYNGNPVQAGASVDSDTMWIGTVRDGDTRFSNLALWTLMLFPYSLSEFLLERQLKKYKAGTLYPDMIEFRPIVRSNKPYLRILYFMVSTGEQITKGSHIPIGSKIQINIATANTTDEISSVTVNGKEIELYTKDEEFWRYRLNVTKSPQKINIVISSYLTMLGNETLISNETLIKNE